ncbi:heterokaryon incompatibility protein [Xylariales sp. PMI_506]|nr:heterokaryon incompatibility protein [Xylariales sp. PMI_506]
MNTAGSNLRTSISYKKLSSSKLEIRLLEILPAESIEEKIVSRLITTRLDDDVEYLALSYLWGDITKTDALIVNNIKVQVPSSLSEALRHIRATFRPFSPAATKNYNGKNSDSAPRWLLHALRHFRSIVPEPSNKQPLRLWVDALCVNQQSHQEKADQMANMMHIYGSAKMVVGWLGPKDEHTDALINAIQAIEVAMPPHWGEPGDRERNPLDYAPHHSWLPKIAHLWAPPPGGDPTAPAPAPAHLAAIDFFAKPFFQRSWILQEIALARFPTFQIGTSLLSWKSVLRLAMCIDDCMELGSDVVPQEATDGHQGLPLETIQTLINDLQRRYLMESQSTHTQSQISQKS